MNGDGDITIWQVFWMIVAVVPASKFIREIFMKLIARVGGINEESLVGKGLGLLSLAALTTGKKGMPASLPGGALSLVNGDVLTGESGGINSPTGGGGGVPFIPPSLPGISQNQGSLSGINPTPMISSSPMVAPSASTPAANTSVATDSRLDLPSGYAQRDSGMLVPTDYKETQAVGPTPSTDIGRSTMVNPMQQTLQGKGIERAGRAGYASGYVSSLGIPQMAPALGAGMAAGGRGAYTATAMTAGLAKETFSQLKEGHGLDSFGNAVKNYTGQDSLSGGLSAMTGSMIGSTFGSHSAMSLGNHFSGAAEKIFTPDYRMDWHNPLLKSEED